jgi:outer membrane autotransporter protein
MAVGAVGASAGGAIFTNWGDITIDAGTLTLVGNQTRNNGGAVFAGASGAAAAGFPGGNITINANTLTIQNNIAMLANGGGLNAIAGSVTLTAGPGATVITGNQAGTQPQVIGPPTTSSATANGGAIFAGTFDNLTFTGTTTISNNSAGLAGGGLPAGSGGAIYAGTSVTLTDNGQTTFSGNTATANGGAISANTSSVTLTDNGQTTFSGNTATANGGAIFAGTGVALNANAATTFSGNTAGGNGGAIFGSSSVALNALGADIDLTGNHAGALGGAIYLDTGSLSLNATGGNIIFSNNSDDTGFNAIFLNNTAGGTTATFNAAAGHEIDFFDPIANNAANGLVTVDKTGPGIVSFDGLLHANDSQIYANTTVEEGTFEIRNGAIYGETERDLDAADGPSTFSTAPGTILQGGVLGTVETDEFTLGGTLNIAGRTTPGAPFSDFVISGGESSTGTAVFQPGSSVQFNTFLGADSNTSSDHLIINNSAATGSSLVHVTNVNGPGALTTANGILLVQATGTATTEPGMFTLAGEVRGGAFDYRLFQGSNPETPDPTLANDWFLRSTFIPTPPPPPPPEPPPPEPPPPEPPAPPPLEPIIGPELATYGVVQPTAREMGLMTLGTLQQRVGDTAANLCTTLSAPAGALITKAPPAATNGCCPAATPSSDGALITKAPPVAVGGCWPSVWGRFYGQEVNNQYQAFAEPRATGWMGGFQGGIDLYRGSLWWPGTDVAGLYFSYADSTIDVTGLVTNPEATAFILTHTGKLGLNAYSVGGYWTHYFPGDAYLDAVLQGTWYNGGASTQFASLPINGSGFVSSLEGGYPIPLVVFGPRFVLEPQAQIIYQQVAFDNANDGLGPVSLGTTSGATGRLGVRGQWTFVGQNGELWQPYVRANVWRDWGAEATTTFGIDQVPLNEQATRLEFAGGLTTKIDPHLSFYGQAGYQFAVSQTTDGVRRNAVMADVGVRYQW